LISLNRSVLAGQPPVGLLDGLGVGVLLDAEDPVVVLESDSHPAISPSRE
jgi:hypothetical protein